MNALSPALAVAASPAPLWTEPDAQSDAELIALCDEFRASEAAFCAIYDRGEGVDDDDACDRLAAPIRNGWTGMLARMAACRASTSAGLAARAMALAQHSGIKPGTCSYAFAFEPGGDTVTGQLLHYLLRDAVGMVDDEPRRAAPTTGADADLIAVCDEFCKLQDTYDTALHPDGGDAPQAEFDRFYADEDRLSDRMIELPCTTVSGVQAMGRALAAWNKELLRDTPARDLGDYITSHLVDRLLTLPAAAVEEPASDRDAKLLALRPEFERLRDACIAADDGVDPDSRSDEDVGLPFDILCKRIAMLPPAVTAAGRALKAIAALHQLTYVDAHNDGPNGALHTCWTMLAADVAGHYPLPREATDERAA